MSEDFLTEIKKHISEEVTRMHGSSNESISRLFYDFRTDVVKEIAILQAQGKEIIKHQKVTNGRVNKNEEELELIHKDMQNVCTSQDLELLNGKLRKNFWLTMKILTAVFLMGSFIWIKESRDFILSVFFKFF